MKYYSKDHEYITINGHEGTVGISDHAQNQLGDVVFAEMPDIGKIFKQGQEAAVVESVKAASDIYSPVSGEVIAINHKLNDQPAAINEDSEGAGWFYKIKIADLGELKNLMNETEYKAYLETL